MGKRGNSGHPAMQHKDKVDLVRPGYTGKYRGKSRFYALLRANIKYVKNIQKL
jgi:hypothetical protein